MTKIQKVLLTGRSHTTPNHRDGAPRAGEERVDIQLSSPNDPSSAHTFTAVLAHPSAEQLFAGAWSACYITAVELVAKGKKVTLPPDRSVDIEIDLGQSGAAYLLQARLNVNLPGVPHDVADLLAHAAHEICPYSKATRGNIDVSVKVVTS